MGRAKGLHPKLFSAQIMLIRWSRQRKEIFFIFWAISIDILLEILYKISLNMPQFGVLKIE